MKTLALVTLVGIIVLAAVTIWCWHKLKIPYSQDMNKRFQVINQDSVVVASFDTMLEADSYANQREDSEGTEYTVSDSLS